MIDLLLPTGLYRLQEDSHVMQELKAYAVGLDRLAEAFDDLIREAFIQTAEGIGLTFWERQMRLSSLAGDTEARRRRLAGLLFMPDDAFTVSDITAALASLGADVTVREDFENEQLLINGSGYIGAGRDGADIAGELAAVLPAHLGAELSIRIGSWYYWESRGLTFSQWDAEAKTFAQHADAARLDVHCA